MEEDVETVIEVTAELVACPSPGSIHITVPASARIEHAAETDANAEEVHEAHGREAVRSTERSLCRVCTRVLATHTACQ